MSGLRFKSDLIGKRFGKLIVISYDGMDNTGKNSKWKCLCDCGNKTIVGRPCLRGGHTRSCGCIISTPIEEYDLSRERDFFKFVEKTDTCWIWNGVKDKEGYGLFSYRTKQVKSHRYSYTRFIENIPSGCLICHTCDNPSCVNPDHLYMGTHLDNMKDVRERKRRPKNLKHLNEKQKIACKILKTSGFSFREIGEVLNISMQTAKKYSGDTECLK